MYYGIFAGVLFLGLFSGAITYFVFQHKKNKKTEFDATEDLFI